MNFRLLEASPRPLESSAVNYGVDLDIFAPGVLIEGIDTLKFSTGRLESPKLKRITLTRMELLPGSDVLIIFDGGERDRQVIKESGSKKRRSLQRLQQHRRRARVGRHRPQRRLGPFAPPRSSKLVAAASFKKTINSLHRDAIVTPRARALRTAATPCYVRREGAEFAGGSDPERGGSETGWCFTPGAGAAPSPPPHPPTAEPRSLRTHGARFISLFLYHPRFRKLVTPRSFEKNDDYR